MENQNREELIKKEEQLIDHLENKAELPFGDNEPLEERLINMQNVKIRPEEIVAMVRLPEEAKKKDILKAWEGEGPVEDICNNSPAKTLVVTAKKTYLSPEPLSTWKKRYDEANFLNLRK